MTKSILFSGPYTTNYSLAKVNRGLALAMQKAGKYSVTQKEDTGAAGEFDVTIFNNFPSSPDQPYGLSELSGKLKLMYMAWEETVFPADKADEINANMHGVMAASHFTRNLLRQNGVQVPIEIVPNALDSKFFDCKPQKYKLDTAKKFKFVHVSTARMRKGVDLLLKAYFARFTADDDVCLVIKSFPSPDNLVNDLLGELKKQYPNGPEVLHIHNPNLTEEEVIDLVAGCDCAVYPTRAEGFGLPIAEAMYLNVPVIVTGYSGHMDFCNVDNAFLLDYELVNALDSEFANIGSKWAEPNLQQLGELMHKIFTDPQSAEIKSKTEHAHTAAGKLTWEHSAKLAEKFIEQVEPLVALKNQHIAVVSPYNTSSGLAEYTIDLYRRVIHSFDRVTFIANKDVVDHTRNDGPEVVRLWELGDTNLDDTVNWLVENKVDLVHWQAHPHEIKPAALSDAIEKLQKQMPSMKIFVTPHSVRSKGVDMGEIAAVLKSVNHVFVHNQQDLDYLRGLGVKNSSLFPHPYDEYPMYDQNKLRERLGFEGRYPILISHGLASHHKGLLQTVEAVRDLIAKYPDILWLSLNAVNINNISSSDTFAKLSEFVQEHKLMNQVRLFPEFLDAHVVATLIQASDIGLLPYDEVGESTSGAIRKFMGVGLPTIVTDIPTMKELHDTVYKVPTNSPEDLAQGVEKLAQDKKLYEQIKVHALEMSQKYSWENFDRELLKLYATT